MMKSIEYMHLSESSGKSHHIFLQLGELFPSIDVYNDVMTDMNIRADFEYSLEQER